MEKMLKLFGVILSMGIALPVFAEKGGSAKVNAAGNFSVGMGPIGNIYTTDRHPEMSPGVGAVVFFDYRWSPELSTTGSVMMLVQDGTDSDRGENSIVFLGIPTFDVKYFFITNPSRWDPYAAAGIGYYVTTSGARGRGTATGLGAQLGVGTNYYLTSKLSVGVASYFRSVALLGSGSTGSFPLSFLGNFAFHF